MTSGDEDKRGDSGSTAMEADQQIQALPKHENEHARMVIVVDDNAIWRQGSVAIINELPDFQADGLTHSKALERDNWDDVSAVIIDLHEPTMALDKYPGFKVCEHIRKKRSASSPTRPIRLYAATSFADDKYVRGLTEFYGFDYRYSKRDLLTADQLSEMLTNPKPENVPTSASYGGEHGRKLGRFRERYLKLPEEVRAQLNDRDPSKQGNLRKVANKLLDVSLSEVRKLKARVLGESTTADKPRFDRIGDFETTDRNE
jgi:CheY-like chemotaxis protein